MTGGDLNFIRAVTDKNLHKDISIMANELKDYCKEHGYDNPKFWPASCTKDYAVSIRMRDNDRWGWEEFEIYIKGQMNMGGFVNLMEQAERIGSEIVTIKRPLKQVFLSFLYFKLSRQLYAFLNLLIIGWIGYYPIGYFKNAIKIVIFLYTLSPLTQTI